MSEKEHNLFSLQKRILVLIVLISFIFCALFVRLFVVQIINSQYLQNKAQSQWTRSLPIIAERGKIYDTNGTTLALSYASYDIYTRGKEVKNAVEVADFLSKTLDLKFEKVYNKATNRSISEVLICNQVDSLTALKIHKKQFAGVYIAENCSRYYPFGDLLTQVLGFVTIDNQGQAGIEQYFNKTLCGVNGTCLVQSDLTGVSLDNSLEYYLPASPGNNINLTINSQLQMSMERTLETIMTEQKAKSATAILMKANSGEILAMSTKPSFDLNNLPRDDVDFLMSSVKNQAVVDVYEPGSTFKIVTMSIALELGVARLEDRFFCGGSCIVDGEKIKCWKSIGHGSQSLAEGLANSCNCVFTTLAQRIGLEKFYEYLYKFGYGTKSGIEISGESSGILMNKDNVKIVDLARMGFGQAVAVTPLQQITAISSCVNGGKLFKPFVVKSITDEKGNILQDFSQSFVRNTISEKTSSVINDMLDLTVSKQTGKYTFVNGYAVGGKTGTTQKYENGAIAQGKYISSFVGTYPVDKPEYVLLISVDEPGAGAYFGSVVASPYAKIIFGDLFKYYNIPFDSPELKENVTLIKMPSLVGMSLTQAVQKLNELEIDYEIAGEGAFVKEQIPSANIDIYPNDCVVVQT